MKTNFNNIVDVSLIGKPVNTISLNDILKLANQESIQSSSQDTNRNLLIAIDIQQDFMDNGALGVPGANKDVENLTNWMYNNLEKITQITASIDTHQPFQIFHPCWWIDENGDNPDPFTIISVEDLDSGKWRAVINPIASREYVAQLKNLGNKLLCIWAYHCLQGTTGHVLENQFSNMMYFHSVARKVVADRMVKGYDPMTEMYGIIKPEYDPKNTINIKFLNKLVDFEKIIIAGEAFDYCVFESIKQILEHYSNNLDFLKKVYILEDCSSMIDKTKKEMIFMEILKILIKSISLIVKILNYRIGK